MKRIHGRLLAGGAAASLVVGTGLAGASAASAAEYTVTDEAELRAAVAEANAEPGPDTIVLGSSITLSIPGVDGDGPQAGDLDVSDELRVVGGGEAIDGGGVDRIFDVSDDGTLQIQDLVLRNGAPAPTTGGGAIRSVGSVVVMDSLLADNVVSGAGASGGAILNDGGDLELLASRLRDNTAERAGGGIEADLGTTTVRNSVLVGNRTGAAPGNGGALHLTGAGRVSIFDSSVIKNEAASEGGGLWNSADGTMRVRRSLMSDNVARGDAADNGGGGVFNDGGSLLLRNSAVADNAATGAAGSGGGVFNNAGEVTVIATAVTRNRAQRAGGGIEALTGTTELTRSTLARNHTGAAPGNGGGLHLTGEGTVSFVDGAVVANRASSEGGGLWNSSTGTMTVSDSRLRGNVARGAAADNGGGALFNDGGELEVERSRIVGNAATGSAGSGGGILNNLGTLLVADTVLRKNESTRAGGGVETNGGFVALTRVRLLGNATGDSPGNGGGFHTTGDGQVGYVGGRVVGNSARFQGGGLWNSATGTMTVTGVEVRGNRAQRRPNNYNDGGDFTFNGNPVRVG